MEELITSALWMTLEEWLGVGEERRSPPVERKAGATATAAAARAWRCRAGPRGWPPSLRWWH